MNKKSLQIECYRTVTDLEPVREKWNRIVLAGSGEISLTYEWMLALEETHYGKDGLFYLAYYRNGELLGILPLFLKKTSYLKIPVRKLTFVSNAYCNHNDLVFSGPSAETGNVIGEIMPLLEEYIGNWDMLEIDEVMTDSPRMKFLEQACPESGYTVLKKDISRSPYIPLGSDFDLVYRTLRSGDSRRKIRKLEKELQALDGYQISYHTSPESVSKTIEAILDIERASWKAQEKTDIASHPVQIAFYRRFAELAAARGWLNVALLSIGPTPVAYEYNLYFGKRCFHLKGSYDSEFKYRSPSKVLKKEVLRTCCENGAEEYDYTGQEQEHKMEWTDKMRGHQRWYIYNRTHYGRLLSWIGHLKNLLPSKKD